MLVFCGSLFFVMQKVNEQRIWPYLIFSSKIGISRDSGGGVIFLTEVNGVPFRCLDLLCIVRLSSHLHLRLAKEIFTELVPIPQSQEHWWRLLDILLDVRINHEPLVPDRVECVLNNSGLELLAVEKKFDVGVRGAIAVRGNDVLGLEDIPD